MPTDALAFALRQPARTQADVQYIITETRKLLETQQLKTQFKDLLFFCDWTVHPKLDRPNTVQPIIDEFNSVIQKTAITRSFAPMTQRLKDIVSFDLLRTELRRFLTNNGLPTDQVDNTGQWAAFIILYVNIIRECPLELKSGYCLYVRQLNAKLQPQVANTQSVMVTEWRLSQNGKHIATIFNEGYIQTTRKTYTIDSKGNVVEKVST